MVTEQDRDMRERVVRLETLLGQMANSQEKMLSSLDDLRSEQEQRVARAAIGKGVFEITKLIIAAFSGAMATLILSRGH